MAKSVGPEFLASLVTHHLGFKDNCVSSDDSSSSSMTSHRLSALFETEDGEGEEDHGEDEEDHREEEDHCEYEDHGGENISDKVIVSEVMNITNMIEELSKKANEELEVQRSETEHLENGLESNIEEVDIRTTEHEIKSVTIERQKDVFHETEESSDNSEEEDVFEENNAIVYSFTLGDNTPVIIQKVGEEVIEKDPEEENDCIGQPIESKLVIDTDGKVSEINKGVKKKRNQMDDIEEHKNSNSNNTFEETTSISDEINGREVNNVEVKNLVVKNEEVKIIEETIEEVKNMEVKCIEVKNEEVNNLEVKKEVKNIEVKNEEVKNIEVKYEEVNNKEEMNEEVNDIEVKKEDRKDIEVNNSDTEKQEGEETKPNSANSDVGKRKEEKRESTEENRKDEAGKRKLRDILFQCFLCGKIQKD